MKILHKVVAAARRFWVPGVASETPEGRHNFDIRWHARELRRLLLKMFSAKKQS